MTKKIDEEDLILPEFNLKFAEVVFLITQYLFRNFDLSNLEDLPTMIKKSYDDENTFKKLEKKLFKNKKQLLIRDSDNFIIELLQSFYRLRLSVKLTKELNCVDRTERLERISYYKENFHNEYFIFTERVIRYLNTLKNDYKEYKNIINKLVNDFREIFITHRALRNDHIHMKRKFYNNYYKTVITDLAEKYEVNTDLPTFDETFEKMKRENIDTMLEEMTFLCMNTDITLNDFAEHVFNKIIND